MDWCGLGSESLVKPVQLVRVTILLRGCRVCVCCASVCFIIIIIIIIIIIHVPRANSVSMLFQLAALLCSAFAAVALAP